MDFYKIFILLLFTGLLWGCDDQKKEDGEVKFVATAQDVRDQDYYGDALKEFNKYYLINSVHTSIQFTLAVSGDCVSESEAEKFVSDGIDAWLVALEDQGKAGKVKFLFDSSIDHDVTRVDSGGAINIKFNCEDGVSAYTPKYDGVGDLDFYYDNPSDYDSSHRFISKFAFTTALHEFGHAFGLSDTYIIGYDEKKHLDKSTNSDSHTFGSQPRSIMNDPYNYTELQEDDKDGIVWLYEHHFTRAKRVDECPNGYKHESATGGCIKQ